MALNLLAGSAPSPSSRALTATLVHKCATLALVFRTRALNRLSTRVLKTVVAGSARGPLSKCATLTLVFCTRAQNRLSTKVLDPASRPDFSSGAIDQRTTT